MSLSLQMFQFHTGSIKSTGQKRTETRFPSFNSILVRLKGRIRANPCRKVQGFNSILVRLKGDGNEWDDTPSKKVSIPYWFD